MSIEADYLTKRTLAEEVEFVAGEPVEAVVIGKDPWNAENAPSLKSASVIGKLLPWSEARSLLSYRWYDGFGSAGCHAVVAWSKSRVVFVSEYDGSTTVTSVPRNPEACNPDMPGGG